MNVIFVTPCPLCRKIVNQNKATTEDDGASWKCPRCLRTQPQEKWVAASPASSTT